MPPRYSYWTIIAGGLPTAFRAADRDELLPTFTQIRQKHPDAEMKWFARGKLWDSPESARRDSEERRQAKRPLASPARHGRGRDWRPGGDHRDPRQPYKDAKQARNTRERKRKFERRQRFADAGQHRDRDGQVRPRGPTQWNDKGPRRSWNSDRRSASGPRQFDKKSFGRNQRKDEPAPPRPEPPEREPRPREGNEPTPPPRPAEPSIPAPGPPERGRFNKTGRRRQ